MKSLDRQSSILSGKGRSDSTEMTIYSAYLACHWPIASKDSVAGEDPTPKSNHLASRRETDPGAVWAALVS